MHGQTQQGDQHQGGEHRRDDDPACLDHCYSHDDGRRMRPVRGISAGQRMDVRIETGSGSGLSPDEPDQFVLI